MGAPPGPPEAVLPVNKGSAGAGNGQVTTPRMFRNPAGCCGPSTPILIHAQRQHPRSPNGNVRSQAVALQTLPPEAHGARSCRVPTPEAAPGFWQPGASPPSRRCRGSAPQSQVAQSGHPGTSRRRLEAARAATPAVPAAPVSPRATASLLLTTKETCDRRAKTLSVTHPWPMWGRHPFPEHPGRCSSYCQWALKPPRSR